MSSSILSKLFWAFAIFCFLLLVQSGDDANDKTQKPPSLQEQYSQVITDTSIQKLFPLFYIAYQKVIETKNPGARLQAISNAFSAADDEGVNQPAILRKL